MRYSFDERFYRAPKLNATLAWAGADTYSTAGATAIETANKQFELLGTNAADAASTLSALGGISLETAGAQADQMIVRPHTDTNQCTMASINWNTARRPSVGWSFFTKTVTGSLTCMGIRPAATLAAGATALDTATDNDKILVRAKEGTDTNWQVIVSVAGVETTYDSGVALASSTRYYITWEVDGERTSKVTFYSGTPGSKPASVVRVTDVLTNSTNLGVPFFGIEANGAAAESIILARMRGSLNQET